MVIQRPKYLKQLVAAKGNGMMLWAVTETKHGKAMEVSSHSSSATVGTMMATSMSLQGFENQKICLSLQSQNKAANELY
ncbi:MAG: hypothetical protein K6A94_08095 [Bacteroidales bacterium]|nr:hypothetical protein [Bacteroidales bacterium]